jgi:tetratricopeptide (TPR) repeat protein
MFSGVFSFEEEVKRFTKKLKEAKEKGDRRGEGDALEGLAICYSAMRGHEDAQKAIEYYNRAIPIFRMVAWWEMYYKAMSSLGLIYEKLLNDPDNAIQIYERAVREGGEAYSENERHYRDRIVRSIEHLKYQRA